jgi:hypothetical protein
VFKIKPEDDPQMAEVDQLFINLTDDQKVQALAFLRFLHQFEDEANGQRPR